VQSQFSEDDLIAIRRQPIKLSTGEERDAIRLADSWAAHVEKIDDDRALPWSDRTVWNEFDLCAAMIVREYVEDAIAVLPEYLRAKMYDYISDADERFMAVTVTWFSGY
jgi:hypothetical protein